MRYRIRIPLLICIWLLFIAVAMIGTAWFSYERSMETAERTIQDALIQAREKADDLALDELTLRLDYEDELNIRYQLVRLLQKHDLEETVPSKAHLKKYAELMKASYLAVLDPRGKTVVSTGEKNVGEHTDVSINTAEEAMRWMTSSMILDPDDFSECDGPLQDGYRLYYQVNNEDAVEVEKNTFSWRTILWGSQLPNNASFTAISKTDNTVLVYPDDDLVGKDITSLGYSSMDDFLSSYTAEDDSGILWNQSLMFDFSKGGLTIFSQPKAGMIETEYLYVICSVPKETADFYIYQTLKTLLPLFILGTFLILCYILFFFGDQYRRKKKNAGTGSVDGAPYTASEPHGRFHYDGRWMRHLLICSLIVLLGTGALSLHVQLLSNAAQTASQKEQADNLEKKTTSQMKEQKDVLEDWYNERNLVIAEMTAYLIDQGGDEFNTRSGMKEIQKAFDISGIYLFGQNGKVDVTSTNFDHIDLYKNQKKAMAKTFLPLLEGHSQRAWVPLEESDTELTSYAGVSVRDERDLCDGCVGIENNLPQDLGFVLFDGMVWNIDSSDVSAIHLSTLQKHLTVFILITMMLCLLLMNLIGTVQRRHKTSAEGRFDPQSPADSQRLAEAHSEEPAESGSDELTEAGTEELMKAGPDKLAEARFDELTEAGPEKPAKVGSDELTEAGSEISTEASGAPETSDASETSDGSETSKAYETSDGSETSEGSESYDAYETSDTNENSDSSEDHSQGSMDFEEIFATVTGRDKDMFFYQRWNWDTSPLWTRSPEKKLSLLISVLLFVTAVVITLLYTGDASDSFDSSITRTIFDGKWDRGLNIYAVTASAMLAIVAIVATGLLHQLIFLVAYFCSERGETICHLVNSLISYAAIFLAVFYSLLLFGIDTRTLLASAGVLTIVIGFGANTMIADILAGIFLIFEDVIHVGDFVILADGKMGVVMNVGVRMTKIQIFGTTIAVNNADMKGIQNLSGGDSRVSIYLPIDLGENLDRVEEVINRELPGIEQRLYETGYNKSDLWYSGVSEITGESYTLRFDVFCINYRYGRVLRFLNGEFLKLCSRNNIRTVHKRVIIESVIDDGDGTQPPALPGREEAAAPEDSE